MPSFSTFVLWLHLCAIVAWVGGLFGVSFLFLPVVKRRTGGSNETTPLVVTAMQRFARISRELITVILITGIFNVTAAGVARSFHFDRRYLIVLAVKVALFGVIVGIQMWQSYRLAPALAVGPVSGGRPERRLFWTSLLALALAATVILLGLKLRYR